MAAVVIGHKIFTSKFGVFSEFKIFSTTASSIRTIDELDGDTAVQRRCFASDEQSVDGASLHGQTVVGRRELGAGDQEKRARCAPLREYILVDYGHSSSSRLPGTSCQNTKYQDILTLGHSAHLFAARPEAVSVGSGAWSFAQCSPRGAPLCDARPP